jgi:hypothetical protein
MEVCPGIEVISIEVYPIDTDTGFSAVEVSDCHPAYNIYEAEKIERGLQCTLCPLSPDCPFKEGGKL